MFEDIFVVLGNISIDILGGFLASNFARFIAISLFCKLILSLACELS